VGATDAEIFEKEFAPTFILDDFVNLSAAQIYLRLMIDGVGSQPFSARTLPPVPQPANSYTQAVIAHTRATYGRPRFDVEDEIVAFYAPIQKEEKKEPKKEQYNDNQKQDAPEQRDRQEVRQFPSRKQESTPEAIRVAPKNERTLPVRKITDQTPLPPRRFEPKREEVKKEPTKQDVYFENRKIEEEIWLTRIRKNLIEIVGDPEEVTTSEDLEEFIAKCIYIYGHFDKFSSSNEVCSTSTSSSTSLFSSTVSSESSFMGESVSHSEEADS
jgi:hypothetical protein